MRLWVLVGWKYSGNTMLVFLPFLFPSPFLPTSLFLSPISVSFSSLPFYPLPFLFFLFSDKLMISLSLSPQTLIYRAFPTHSHPPGSPLLCLALGSCDHFLSWLLCYLYAVEVSSWVFPWSFEFLTREWEILRQLEQQSGGRQQKSLQGRERD